jgi:hypothetical protein
MWKPSRTQLSIIVAATTIIAYFAIMPSNCELFSSDYGPQSCHTIPLPEYCCTDFYHANIAPVILVFGMLLSLVLFWTRKRQIDEVPKIFE